MMTSNIPSLTISKSFYIKKYNYISNYLKAIYGSQSHNRINIYNNIIYKASYRQYANTPIGTIDNTPVTPIA